MIEYYLQYLGFLHLHTLLLPNRVLNRIFIDNSVLQGHILLFIFMRKAIHRSLNSDSHKRFCNRDFAYGPYILDYGESKKCCLNSGRNRSAHTFLSTFVKYIAQGFLNFFGSSESCYVHKIRADGCYTFF